MLLCTVIGVDIVTFGLYNLDDAQVLGAPAHAQANALMDFAVG